ncbi:Superfamily I DNA or RNA helicase [Epibacterium ulvae]|uniref:DNA 3'-5' helicase n=1 Tax=Epibacterium ulvae TaxID=1156985 RepID=A0A1G5PNY3_9RHOB|nr:UvrD-helicase domain-containing protein [Epibacterium ulvae]SCZ51254.1 Superfamily I DNA or RNA helicase [Epibacterium ulvae]
MDPIERGRQRADELHKEIVATGVDPSDLMGIALAAVGICGKYDVEVQKAKPGSAPLKGCHAYLDTDLAVLVYAETGDTFLDAFHVAHEVGHLEFGGQVHTDTEIEPDPLRPTEVASVGVERVVDYGRRQRREVQMDLFARELLFPRSLARTMHLNDLKSASSISAELGIPFAVTAMQIMDAILLPVRPPFVAKAPTPKPLNDVQTRAAEHRGSPFLLEAGPGTGKTQTLVGRITSLRDEGADPERLLVLTYSNKAAGEMLERITSAWPEAAGKMWVGTFHSFGLDLIRRFYDKLGLPDNPVMMDQTEAIELLEIEYAHLDLTRFRDLWDPTDKLRSILSAISRAKDEVVDAQKYANLATAMVDEIDPSDEVRKKSALICEEVAKVYEVYERLKKQRNKLDFGDLVALPVGLFESDPIARSLIQSEYDHVLVDEYQDVNRASVRLLKAVVGNGENLWVVGDAKQSIYRFRGASSYNLIRFDTEDFPNGARAELTTNYRSSDEICKAFETFARSGMRNAPASFKVDAARGALKSKPQFIRARNKDDEIEVLAKSIQAVHQTGVPYQDQAVLCKGNERLAALAAGLEERGIPALFLGPLFERDEIRELMSLLSLAVEARPMGLVKVACMKSFEMELNDVEMIVLAMREASIDRLGLWPEFDTTNLALSSTGRVGFERLQAVFKDIGPATDPWDLLTRVLLDDTHHLADLAKGTTASNRNASIAIWQFMNFLRTFPREGDGYPIQRLMNHVRRIALLADDRDLRQLPDAAQEVDAVRLMTMHGSKGLEFPVVHVPSLTKDSIPIGFSGFTKPLDPPDGMIEGVAGPGIDALREGHEEEQECLFFVAMSRAEDQLYLYAATETIAKGNTSGRNRPSSPFVSLLGDTIETPPVDGTTARTSRNASPIGVNFDAPLELYPAIPDQYMACPRKVFYTHIMKLGGRRRETPFMLMHNTVQKFVDTVKTMHGTALAWANVAGHFEQAWVEEGPTENPYCNDYKSIAHDLCQFFIANHAGLQGVEPPKLEYHFGDCYVVLRPDEAHTISSPSKTLRRIRTGRMQRKPLDNLEICMLFLASEIDPSISGAEMLFLTSHDLFPVELKTQMAKNRVSKLHGLGKAFHQGRFETNPDDRCPNCSNYFVCGKLPAGTVRKKNLN